MAEYTITDTDLDAIKLATRALRAHDLLFNAVRLDTLIERLTPPLVCSDIYRMSLALAFSCTLPAGHPYCHERRDRDSGWVFRWGPNA